MNILTSTIYNRLVFFLIAAVLVPVIGLIIALGTGTETYRSTMLAAFVDETADLNARAITERFGQTIAHQANMAEQLSEDMSPLLDGVLGRDLDEAAVTELADWISQELTEHPGAAYEESWIVTTDGTAVVHATVATGPEATERITDFSDTDTFQQGTQLINDGVRQSLVVTQSTNGIVFDIIVALMEGTRAQGFLITRINAEVMLSSILNPSELSGDLPYSYLILPPDSGMVAGNAFITSRTLTDAGLVTSESVLADGPQRAILNDTSLTLTYMVPDGENATREVVGHIHHMEIAGQSFLVVTEINTDAVYGSTQRQVITAAGITLLGSIIFLFILAYLLNRNLTRPVHAVIDGLDGLRRGAYETPVPSSDRSDELGHLTNAFLQARQALAAEKEDIEDRLSTLARDLRVIQEISQTSVEERDLQQLMNRVVNLIIERFSQIYHAQIFIVEERNEFAVLRASTGEAGKNLLARGHRLPVGSVSVIGQVTEQGQLVVARDTAASEVHRRNEFLYETRAELAIPLQINGRIIGALDVQSRYNDSFDEAMTNALTMLADQLTIAIENARLFTESQRFLNDLEATQRETVRRRWAEYLTQQRGGQLYSNSGQNTGYDFSELTEMAQQEGRAAIGEATDRDTIPFVVPIMLREQLLGFAEYEVRKQDFHPEMVVLAEELVGRLALGIDNARLFNESQQTAERERIVNEISARITGKTEVADILQTAISEVSRVLRTPKVAARLHTGQAAVSENGHNNGHT
ncbi:MAG: GAF domain-containing protein [Anaerolineae bacterium]|nr:GAF domain-containing protein [Anaerolineae bacterium]